MATRMRSLLLLAICIVALSSLLTFACSSANSASGATLSATTHYNVSCSSSSSSPFESGVSHCDQNGAVVLTRYNGTVILSPCRFGYAEFNRRWQQDKWQSTVKAQAVGPGLACEGRKLFLDKTAGVGSRHQDKDMSFLAGFAGDHFILV